MLTGKIALVTGASRGIGRAVAKELAGRGAYVIVNYCGSAEKAEEVVSEIQSAGSEAESLKCDVADVNACEAMIKDVIARKKRIDILVNNAGITRDNLLMKMSEEEFDPPRRPRLPEAPLPSDAGPSAAFRSAPGSLLLHIL